MDNKDEKTFTDLFSNSRDETETNTQTFSDLLKGSSIKEESSKESSTLTFDNIFDKIPENKPIEGLQQNIEKNIDQNIEKTIEENIEETIEEPKTLDFNSIFTETPQSATSQENNYTVAEETIKEEIESSNTPEETIPQEINFNPFFEENTEEETEPAGEAKAIEPTIQEEIASIENPLLENNTSTFEPNNLVLDNSNPFFENNTEVQANSSIDEPLKSDIDFSSNLFFNNNETTPTVEAQPDKEIQSNNIVDDNPFFMESTSNNVEPTIEKNLEANPFFEESLPTNIVTNTGNNTENNPIITSTADNTINNIQASNNNILSNQPVTTSNEDLTPKSTSPFFELEKKSEENPFFQNQINLVENQVPNNPNNGIDTSKSKHYNVKIVKKKEPLIKVILGVISYAFFIWLLLIGTTLLVYVLDIKIRAAKGDYSSPTFNAYVVLTGSMLPEIQVKDVVVTKKIDAADLKEGDVITFASADSRFAGTIITHRIIKKNPPTENQGYTFQTQGDNNNVADSALVPEANIYGKVILKIPKLGYLQEFLASDGGWIIVILIPCLTVMSYDIVKLIKGMKRKKYKNIKVQK